MSKRPRMGHKSGRRRHDAGAAAAIAKEIGVAVVGLGKAIAYVTDENLRAQVSAELMDLTWWYRVRCRLDLWGMDIQQKCT